MRENNLNKNRIIVERKLVDNLVRRSSLSNNIKIKEEKHFLKSNFYPSFKVVLILILIPIFFASISSLGSTVSYFSDTEISVDNKFQAGTFSFNISSIADVLGKLSVAEIDSSSVTEPSLIPEPVEEIVGNKEFYITVEESEGSLPASYAVTSGLDPSNPIGCEKLNITAGLGEHSYSGEFQSLNLSGVEEMGEWRFLVFLPFLDTGLPPGALCRGTIFFKAGLAGVAPELANTFSDEKKYNFEIQNWGEDINEEIPVLEITEISVDEGALEEGVIEGGEETIVEGEGIGEGENSTEEESETEDQVEEETGDGAGEEGGVIEENKEEEEKVEEEGEVIEEENNDALVEENEENTKEDLEEAESEPEDSGSENFTPEEPTPE
ncbi:hypothetical protein HZA26_02755 [Candidatus Nomurabacteria bacterium]|nr:hypothetical protein [Candidatus Nomurabacteria bacterium]